MKDIEVTGQVTVDGHHLVRGRLLSEPPIYCLIIVRESSADALEYALDDVVFKLRDYEANGRQPHLYAKWTVGEVSGLITRIHPGTSFDVKDDRTGASHAFPWNTKDDEEAIH